MPEKNIKTAFRFSRIDFYFVTAFYSLYDICMVDMKPCFLIKRHVQMDTSIGVLNSYKSSYSSGFQPIPPIHKCLCLSLYTPAYPYL